MVGGDTNHGVSKAPSMAFWNHQPVVQWNIKAANRIFKADATLIFSGGRMNKMPRPLCVGIDLGCFQAIISSKEIIV